MRACDCLRRWAQFRHGSRHGIFFPRYVQSISQPIDRNDPFNDIVEADKLGWSASLLRGFHNVKKLDPAAVRSFPVVQTNIKELEHLCRLIRPRSAGASSKRHDGMRERRFVAFAVVARIAGNEEQGDKYGERIA